MDSWRVRAVNGYIAFEGLRKEIRRWLLFL